MRKKDTKNTPATKNDASKSSSFGNTLAKITGATALAAQLFLTTPSFSQTAENTPVDLHNKDVPVLVENKDSLEHQKIINTPIDSIFLEYGQETALNIIRKHCIIEINTVRSKHNLPECKENDDLNIISQEYAKYLEKKQILSHTDDKGRHLNDRLQEKGYTHKKCGECLASKQQTIKKLVHVWMNSKGYVHRDVILEKSDQYNPRRTYYSQIGIGYYKKIFVLSLTD